MSSKASRQCARLEARVERAPHEVLICTRLLSLGYVYERPQIVLFEALDFCLRQVEYECIVRCAIAALWTVSCAYLRCFLAISVPGTDWLMFSVSSTLLAHLTVSIRSFIMTFNMRCTMHARAFNSLNKRFVPREYVKVVVLHCEAINALLVYRDACHHRIFLAEAPFARHGYYIAFRGLFSLF